MTTERVPTDAAPPRAIRSEARHSEARHSETRRSGARRPRRPAARTAVAWLALAALLAASVLVATGIGPARIAPADVAATVWAHLTGTAPVLAPTQDAIVWQLRVPRVLVAALVGGGLAVCGAVMQALTRNPLADPYLLGLSSGASTGAVVVLVLRALF